MKHRNTPMDRHDRREAWDRGIAAAADHHIRGVRVVSPYAASTRRHAYWRRAFDRTSQALLKIMEARP